MSLFGAFWDALAGLDAQSRDYSWVVPGARAKHGPCQVFGPDLYVEVLAVEQGEVTGSTFVTVRYADGYEGVVHAVLLQRVDVPDAEHRKDEA